MNKNIGIVVAAAIALVAGGAYYYSTAGQSSTEADTVSGMRAENNMIVVNEQRPSTNITAAIVYLASPGFIVIHEDVNGQPGAIIGSSALLGSGESRNVAVELTRSTKDGEKLHAMLHADTDGSGAFTSADLPVQSMLGGPIEGWFEISSSAGDNVPVSI